MPKENRPNGSNPKRLPKFPFSCKQPRRLTKAGLCDSKMPSRPWSESNTPKDLVHNQNNFIYTMYNLFLDVDDGPAVAYLDGCPTEGSSASSTSTSTISTWSFGWGIIRLAVVSPPTTASRGGLFQGILPGFLADLATILGGPILLLLLFKGGGCLLLGRSFLPEAGNFLAALFVTCLKNAKYFKI